MGAGCGLASAFSKERRHTQLDEAYKGRSAAPASMHRYRFSRTCDVTDASARCTPPVPPDFLPADDRTLDLFDPIPERAMASQGAAPAHTTTPSLTSQHTRPRTDKPLEPHSPPPTTAARLRAHVALHSCPRAHSAVLCADLEIIGMA
ncbi:hypothetical protein JB92DRAFT_3119893 [Gautieria morchelliformis]|nr:hypothetical protein JB92DRAFT_3119893 [Gautieria morchelliformis]